jgi:phosphosulfolactate synthase
MDDATRKRAIKQALDAGLKVVSEVGKKDTAQQLALDEAIRQIERDLGYGVSKVTIEARASAKGIGVYDTEGRVKDDDVSRIAASTAAAMLIWEAPTQAAQEYFIKRFGNNVNLGNVQPDEIIALASLRNGLRGDTFRLAIR